MGRDAGRRRAGTIVAVLLLLAACGGDDGDDRGGGTGDGGGGTTAAPDGGPGGGVSAAELCADAAQADDAPTVGTEDLTEVSGIALSRQSEGVLWAHNDSGGAAEVFAVGLDGADRGRVAIEGVEAFDWEDMALAPGPDGADRLYLGDIGDNNGARDEIVVHRLAEPPVPPDGIAAGTTAGAEPLTLTYADGPRDAETLLADPSTGDLLVVSKQWDGGAVGVYRVPAEATPGTPVAMERVGDVPALAGEMVTGGDVSPDGSLVALRTYFGVQVWDRGAGQTSASPWTSNGAGASQGSPARASATV